MSTPFMKTCLLGALLVNGLMMHASGAPDDFQLALNEAKERVIRYRTAGRSNDRAAIHDAVLRLQEDPLAVRQIGAVTGITKDIEALQNEVRERILALLDESGIRRDRVSFFNVLQPPWDTGFRVDLRIVPTRVSQPFAREAYYELATGQKPPDASDRDARAEYRAAAIQYGGQLAAAWAGTSYFEQNDDRLVAAGVKDARLRGAVPMDEYTSPEARQLAADLRAENGAGTIADQEIEELKQAMRQFDAQVRPPVETAGVQVPQDLAQAGEIVRQVEAGTMTPPQARERIAAMGQTPAGITRRAADWIDRVQVLLPPVTLPPAGGAGAAPWGVFNGNVVQRLIGRRIAGLLQRLDAGLLTIAQARAQLAQINGQAQPAAPAQTAAVPQGRANNLTALLRAAAAAQPTPPTVAPDDPARLRAAGAAMADVAMVPLPPRAGDGNTAGNNTPAAAGVARQTVALSDAIRRQNPDADVWTLPSRINQNEMTDEELRAVAENRPPLYPAGILNGALAGPGERLLLDAIIRSGGSRETILAGSREELATAWTRSRLVEAILVMAGLTRDLQWHAWNAELAAGADLAPAQARLTGHYNNARLAMADLADKAAQHLGDTDPLVLAFQKKVSRLPDPPKVQDAARSRPAELAATSFPRPQNPSAGTISATVPNPSTQPAPPMIPVPPVAPVKTTFKVPDVTKLLKADAEKKITELKLKLVAQAGSDKPPRTAKKGEIYRQSPPAGSEVVEGDTVRLDYYAGIPVGQYAGLKKADAEAAIQKDGFTPRASEGQPAKTAAEGLLVYSQNPAPGLLAWFDDVISIVHHKEAEQGFGDADGAKVDPRLAAAKVHDGGDPTVACYKLSEGKRCIIALPTPKVANMQTASQTWAIVRYPNAASAQAWYNENAAPMTANQNMAGHRETLTRDPAGGVIYSRNMNLGGYKSTDHIRISIYRDVFIIMYAMHEPQPAADVSHAAGIMERSRKLVDERFPKP